MTHRSHAVATMAAPLGRADEHVLLFDDRDARRSSRTRWLRMVETDPGDRGVLQPRAALDLDRVYRDEAPRLQRYFGRHLPSGQDALDFVHESFLRLASARSRHALQRPRAYLQRIARNLLIDRSRHPEIKLASRHVPIEAEDEIAEPAPQEQEIELKDMMRQYRQALDELPARTREVFLLQRIHDLTYQEIADHIGISVPTVQYHIAKALVHLDLRLGQQ